MIELNGAMNTTTPFSSKNPQHAHVSLPRHQGYLIKKKKLVGFKDVYVVLNRGYLIYYHNESDAKNDVSRKGTYSLESASVEEYLNSSSSNYLAYSWTINFPDGRQHTLCSLTSSCKKMGIKTPVKTAKVTSKVKPGNLHSASPNDRKLKWVDAFKQHIDYLASHPEAGALRRQLSVIPAERLKHQLEILKLDQERVNLTMDQIEQTLNALHASEVVDPKVYNSLIAIKPQFETLKVQMEVLIEDMKSYLNLQEQKDLIMQSQLLETKTRCRLFEESLRAFAQENGDSDGVKTKNSGRSPPSSIGGDLVVANNGSSSNSIESDSSDFDEYYDTAEEQDNQLSRRKSEKSKKHVAYQNVANEILTSDIKRNVKINTLEIPDDDKDANRDSGFGEVVKISPVPEIDTNVWRNRLPATMIDRSQISLWSIAKHFIGKELTKISMPVFLCEPLSFLQRIGENAQYSPMLTKTAETTDPCRRMEQMTAYAVSICSSIERISKPFNPILGETYEVVRKDLGFRSISEQVSHHPPISAYHTDSTDPNRYWRSFGSVNPKIKFWGKSVEVEPKGTITVDFPDLNETYFWRPATSTIHNVIVGTPWFEYTGTLEVKCLQTGYRGVINFQQYSRSNKDWHKVDGYIYDNKNNRLKAIFGYWTHCIYSCDADSYDAYMKLNKNPPTAKFDKYFNIVEPLIPLNSHGSSTNLHYSHSTPSIEPNRHSTQSALRVHSNEASASSGDDGMSDNYLAIKRPSTVGNRLSDSKNIMSSMSSLSNILKDLSEVWTVNPQPPYSEQNYYNFSYFALTLNELKKDMEKVIAPTDTRFRSDVRRLEYGDLDGASREKNRLEEKQREARKTQGNDYKARWFYLGKHPQTGDEEWLFNGKYWDRDYSQCPDLF